jgi:hypothetical protein
MPVKTFNVKGRIQHQTEVLFLWTTSNGIYIVPVAALQPYKVAKGVSKGSKGGISKSDLEAWRSENEGKFPGVEFAGIVEDNHIMDGAEGEIPPKY